MNSFVPSSGSTNHENSDFCGFPIFPSSDIIGVSGNFDLRPEIIVSCAAISALVRGELSIFDFT